MGRMTFDDDPPFIGPSPSFRAPDQEAIAWAREVGYAAGITGLPCIPTADFAGFAKPWGDGWRRGAEQRKTNGWASLSPEYE